MGKLVILKIRNGNFKEGFPVTLQIGSDGGLHERQIEGNLPSNPDLNEDYNNWQKNGLKPSLGYKHKNSSELLKTRLNSWLNSEPFRPIKDELLLGLAENDEVRMILEAEDILLHRIPWHLWDFFERCPHAEIALSSPNYKRTNKSQIPVKNKIRILAILGDSEGIDIETDRRLLEQLPGADPLFLPEPQLCDISEQLWEQHWDILFFAGHSKTQEETGRIYINKNQEFLTIDDLKEGLKKSIQRGLKLAIFNSCDGLGLARNLAELHIPQAIVMREPVPDRVAQKFLNYFLKAFSGGETLYLAVKEARKRLCEDGSEIEFPCASWLPVIYQNPAEMPPTWKTLRGLDGVFDALPEKGQVITSPIALSELSTRRVDDKKLYDAFLTLDYRNQEDLFLESLNSHRLAAFLIQGGSYCGQNFFLHRLIKLVDDSTASKIIPIDLARLSKNISRATLLYDFGIQVGVYESSIDNIARSIYEFWQSQNVILIFYYVDSSLSEVLQTIFQIWHDLAELSNVWGIPDNTYHLLMFMVDYTANNIQPNSIGTSVEESKSNYPIRIALPTRLPASELNNWLRRLSNEIFADIRELLSRQIQVILNESNDGVPELALLKICSLCGCKWDNIRGKLNV